MKKLLLGVLVVIVAGVAALGWSLTPARLDVPAAAEPLTLPPAQPPHEMWLSVLHAGKMFSQAAMAYRGGALTEPRVFGMAAILVQHPGGTLLFDTGFGSRVAEHLQTVPLLMRATTRYEKEPTVAVQLAYAGMRADTLKGIVLTHAHWDHVSGVQDLSGAPVWVTQPELDFIRSDDRGARLAHSFGDVKYHVYDFPHGPYAGFPRSYDVFGDGAVVLVPAPGHTPGSVIAFIALESGTRYALVGDLVWQIEGIDIPAERPWLPRQLVDKDAAQVREHIVRMHRIAAANPELVIVPAHDRRVLETLPPLRQVPRP